MKKAILVACFGTTNAAAIQSDILPIEQAVAAAYPDHTIRLCFTSDMVIRRLSEQGIQADSLRQAIIRLIQEEYSQAAILPAMIADGSEYKKLLACAADFQESFSRLTIARPLLDSTEDLETAADFIHNHFPLQENEALLLMGHGTADSKNPQLSALAEILQRTDNRLFLAALEGPPALSDVLEQIRSSHFTKVCLAPLMLTAGTHAVKHLAGTLENSWQNRCRAAGLETRIRLSGLGSSPEIQELFLRHLSASLVEN